MVEVIRLSAKDAEMYWPAVVSYIKRGIDRGEDTFGIGDYFEYVTEEYMDLWVCIKDNQLVGAGVTEIVEHPKKTTCLIRLLSGDCGWDIIQSKAVEEFAKSRDCVDIEMFGRKGWLRMLNKVGWEQSPFVKMRKEI